MKYRKLLFLASLAAVMLFTSCSNPRTYRHAEGLPFIIGDQVYQVRVRTGNMALDRMVYSFAYREFNRYFSVKENGPYDGFIEITFTSEHKKLFRDSTPGYLRNVEYGSSWYTGDIDSREFNRATEIGSDGILSWQESEISVEFRDIEGRRLWSAEYDYRGGRDLTGLYVNSPEKAAKVCIGRILKQFEDDFGVKPRLTKQEKSSLPDFVLIVSREEKNPVWLSAGENRQGNRVYINTEAVSYPDVGIFRMPVSIEGGKHNILELYEIDCPQRKFRVLDRYSNRAPSLSPYTTRWKVIPEESTPELVHDYVCG